MLAAEPIPLSCSPRGPLAALTTAAVASALACGACGGAEPAPAEPKADAPTPVRLALVAVLVAPGKSDGLAWDGTGKLPEDAVEQLKNFEGEGLIGGMVEDSGAGNVLRAGGSIAQWSADAFLGGMAQPEVRVELFLNGKQLLTTGGTEPSYNPTWPDAVTDPLLLRPDDRIALKAWDEDPSNDDEIGMCTLLGRPPVDAHGYVEEHAFRCHGQLLSVARSGRTCVAWDEFGRQARQIVLRCGDY